MVDCFVLDLNFLSADDFGEDSDVLVGFIDQQSILRSLFSLRNHEVNPLFVSAHLEVLQPTRNVDRRVAVDRLVRSVHHWNNAVVRNQIGFVDDEVSLPDFSLPVLISAVNLALARNLPDQR